jgi:peptidoglycan/LPS O-acetylase OafA/YrhL
VHSLTSRTVEGQRYVPGIDGLRALAVLAVMTFHLVPTALPGGFVGVDVFFVISGYVVTGSLLRDSPLPFFGFLAAFYARRFRRIVPALLVCLGATVVVGAMLIPPAWLSSSIKLTALRAFLGLSNYALVSSGDGYFDPRAEFNPFTHTWSLAVEEQFYVLFPLLLYLWISRPTSAAAAVVRFLFGALCLASLLWCAWATAHDPRRAFYLLPGRFWELGAGAALYLAGARGTSAATTRTFGPALEVAGTLLIVTALAVSDRSGYPFPHVIPAVLGSAMLIWALANSDRGTPIARILSSRPAITIGLLSYSLYLWHWPVYTLLRWTAGLESWPWRAAAVVLTTLCATMSYALVERTAQHSPRIRALPAWGTIAGGVGVMALALLLARQVYVHPGWLSQSLVYQHRMEWYPDIGLDEAGDQAQCAVHVEQSSRAGLTSLEFTAARCPGVDRPDSASRRILVVGDSHVWAYSRLLQLTAARTGTSIVAFSRGGCGMADLVNSAATRDAACERYQQRLLAYLLSDTKQNDIVWLASLRVPRLVNQWDTVPAAEVAGQLRGEEAIARRRAAELDTALRLSALTGAGLRVLVDAPKPLFPSPPYRCADSFNRMNPICAAGFSVTREFLQRHREPAIDALRRLASTRPLVHVWDPFPVLCPGEVCKAFEGQRPLYFDGDHLSRLGNERLLPSLLETLRDAFQIDAIETTRSGIELPDAHPRRGRPRDSPRHPRANDPCTVSGGVAAADSRRPGGPALVAKPAFFGVAAPAATPRSERPRRGGRGCR